MWLCGNPDARELAELTAFSAAIGRVAPGWLGLAILAVVQLLAAL